MVWAPHRLQARVLLLSLLHSAVEDKERDKLEPEYKVDTCKCRKWIERVFFQDFCAYLVIRSQVVKERKQCVRRVVRVLG